MDSPPKITDVIEMHTLDVAAELNQSASKVMEYMLLLQKELKEYGKDAIFNFQGDMLDSLCEVGQRLAVLQALQDLETQLEVGG